MLFANNQYETEENKSISKTNWCKNYIASVCDGSLVRDRIDLDDIMANAYA